MLRVMHFLNANICYLFKIFHRFIDPKISSPCLKIEFGAHSELAQSNSIPLHVVPVTLIIPLCSYLRHDSFPSGTPN